MSYIRIKWIKGHPYLYEQTSYRVGKQVKTRHVRYIGKHKYRNAGNRGTSPGFPPLSGLTAARKDDIDQKIARLKYADAYPYEREILRQFLYHHMFEFRIYPSHYVNLQGEVWHVYKGPVQRFAIRNDTGAFAWMHEFGHTLEYEDHLIDEELPDDELTNLRSAFVRELEQAYRDAESGGLEGKAVFIQRFGKLINLRQNLEISTLRTEADKNEFIYQQLGRARAGEIPEKAFNRLFQSWVRFAYRADREEIFADSVATLILNPAYAFEVHGKAGNQYLSKLYIKLYRHLESKYHISLGRPQQEHLEQKDLSSVEEAR